MILLFILSFVQIGYSIAYIDSCRDINESTFIGDRIVMLNQSITGSSTWCISLSTSNFTIDCQNNVISNQAGSYGILDIGGNTNITIQNCNITNVKWGIETSNAIISNSYFSNNNNGIRAYSNCEIYNNTFTNSSFNGILVYIANNQIYNNIFLNTSKGFRIDGSSSATNNYIFNNEFYGWSTSTLDDGASNPINNYIYGNKLFTTNNPFYSSGWQYVAQNYFNYSGIGNYYSNFNESDCTNSTMVSQTGCDYTVCIQENVTIDATNGIYDLRPIIRTSGASCPFQTHPIVLSSSSSTSSSSYPFGGLIPGLLIIIGGLILN